jgi:ligand-binding sensor domain-containing protein/signal transduction histidine kinase
MMRAAVFFVLLIASLSSSAQPADVDFKGFSERLWEAKDGLADQTAQAFAQTSDGSLWIGTKSGLLRFDGVRFATYDRAVAPPAMERGVNCLAVSRDGSLWIGTEGGGVFRYRDHEFHGYSTYDGLTNGFVRAIFEDRRGTVWIGADQGLFQVSGMSLVRIDNTARVPTVFVRAITQDAAGHVWVGGTRLLEFDGQSLIREHDLPKGARASFVLSMYYGAEHTLWLGMQSGLFRITEVGVLKRVRGLSAEVSVIRRTPDGTLWIGTVGRGLYYYREPHFFHIAPANLPSKTVLAVLDDQEGDIWLGTQAGVLRLSKTPVKIIPLPGGADSEFETLYRDLDGSIWVAASEHLFRIRNGVAMPFSFPGLTNLRILTLLRDRDGSVWIGTDGAGVIHLGSGKIEHFRYGQGLINDFVRAILQSSDGTLWVGTNGGLTHLLPNDSTNFDTGHGLAYFSVTCLFEDSKRNIWVGTSRGITRISNGRIVHDSVTFALKDEQIWSIAEDRAGEVLFGTSSGLYESKVGGLVHFTTAQGLADNTVYQVLDDKRGSIWLGGRSSISRLLESDIEQFRSGDPLELTLYEDAHDLNSAALYGGMQPEGAVTPNGDVWFPSNKGAIHIAAKQIIRPASSPVTIEEVRAEGQTLPLGPKILLKPGNGRFEISYAAIHLQSQGSLRYRYQMEGMESWTEAFTRRTAYYTHLPAGRYRFRVQAFEVDDPSIMSEASIVILQQPYFYATSWFMICCALALLGTGFLVYRLRLHQMKVRFNAISEERTRLAREMHDTVIQGCVGVSMLLEAVQEVAVEDPLRQHLLSYVSDQIRTTIESAREAVWALRNTSASAADPGTLCEQLAKRVQLEQGITVRCHIEGAPVKLGELVTHELMMSVKEAIANAVTHGNPNRIDLHVVFTGHGIEIRIVDDGTGFDLAAVNSRNGHYGIVGMQERVQLFRGKLRIDTAPGRGTTVSISVPWRQRPTEEMNRK